VLNPIEDNYRAVDWQGLVHRQGKVLVNESSLIAPLHFIGNDEPITSSLLEAHLPQRLVAYTSGDQLLWTQIEHHSLPAAKAQDLEETGEIEDDRPPGWTLEQEWNQQRADRILVLLQEYKSRATRALTPQTFPGMETQPPDYPPNVAEALDSLSALQRKLAARPQTAQSTPAFRVRPRSLRLAGISVAIWQAAKELKGKAAQWEREAVRKEFIAQHSSIQSGEDARRILGALDWFWPTHLSFTYRPGDLDLSPLQQQQLLCLLALADEVTAQPRGYLRVVISLGPFSSLDLAARLNEAAPYELPASRDKDTPFDRMVRHMSGSATGAEAVLRMFSANTDIGTTLIEAFEGLLRCQQSGIFEDITLTVKRLHQVRSSDGELDDVVIRYEDLSDGEQMLLGRMALFFLVRRQDGTLLLLDEPETHFNDVWKREMIDLVDDAVLKTTTAQVIVATHTSIALTDVFSSEIVRFVKPDGAPQVEEVAFPTFGADPGRILLHVFGSPDTIGSRAAEFLREKLKQEWRSADPVKAEELRAELERLVSEIGSGWPRAKLAEILSKLDAPPSS
jgi:hypothetical protein